MNDSTSEHLDSFLRAWLAHKIHLHDLPGLAIRIDNGDDRPISLDFGMADIEHQEPLTEHHLFNIGSQAKMLTAVAVMQLVEREKLSLDSKAARFLPWLCHHTDPRVGHVTIRHLLGHNGGFVRDGNHADFWQLHTPFPNAAELEELILKTELVLEPDEKFKYSNLGFALLGEIISNVAQQPYEEWVRGNILDPLHMRNTTTHGAIGSRSVARSYGRRNGSSRKSIPTPESVNSFTAATGWYSTTRDTARFIQAQCNGTLPLNKASRQELHNTNRNHWKPAALRGSNYSMGFMHESIGGRQLLGHSGGFLGYRSCSFIEPATRTSVSIMTSGMDTPVKQLLGGIYKAITFFESGNPSEQNMQRFNAHLRCPWEDMFIVTNGERTVTVNPDLWNPFANISEELWIAGPDQLRIDCRDDMHYDNEFITYHFNENGTVESANYAGTTMTPVTDLTAYPLN